MKYIIIIVSSLMLLGAAVFSVYSVLDSKPNHEDSYLGITREEYADRASNGGKDKLAHCAYTFLLGKYGVREVYYMDMRVAEDENDVDPRIYESIELCMEKK